MAPTIPTMDAFESRSDPTKATPRQPYKGVEPKPRDGESLPDYKYRVWDFWRLEAGTEDDPAARLAAQAQQKIAWDEWQQERSYADAAAAKAAAAPDPVDVEWKRNLDRLEQQKRLNELAAGPSYEPTISTTARGIWGKGPDGTMGWIENPNYKFGAGGGDGRTEFESERALRTAQTDLARVQAEKARQEMLGKQQLALQQIYEAIPVLEEMVRTGTVTQAEANAWMEVFKQNLQASLRGTTPFEQEKFQTQETRQRADIGKELLNQRLQSSTSLANTLISSFSQNLPTLGWGLRQGETVPFDPFSMAGAFTTEQQGGQGVSDLGRSLLAGLQQGPGQAGAGPQGQGAMHPNGLPVEAMQILQGVIERRRQQQLPGPAGMGVTP